MNLMLYLVIPDEHWHRQAKMHIAAIKGQNLDEYPDWSTLIFVWFLQFGKIQLPIEGF